MPSAAVAVIVAVPSPLIVTLPLVLATVATFVLLDLKVTVPSVVFVSLFVNAASRVVLFTLLLAKVSFGSAFSMVNVTDCSPLYLPIPVTFAVAVPAFVLSA